MTNQITMSTMNFYPIETCHIQKQKSARPSFSMSDRMWQWWKKYYSSEDVKEEKGRILIYYSCGLMFDISQQPF